MKICITGHSTGLGAELKKIYEANGHTVQGYSRSNGYDLRDWSKIQSMLDQIADFDVFVNLAKPDFSQTIILYELWKRWKGQKKTIINISSVLTNLPICPAPMFDNADIDLYRTAKISLNEATQQLSLKKVWPKILLVKPLHLYSNPILPTEYEKLTNWAQTFVTIIDLVEKNGFRLEEITF